MTAENSSPFNSSMATSPPPFSCMPLTTGTGVTGSGTGPAPSQNEYSALSKVISEIILFNKIQI